MNKEEINLLEIVFTLAIGECAYNDINNIQKLEYKIKTINNLCKKQKEIIDNAIEYIKHYETIRGYYEYEECGYDEYNYEEDLKEELLNILKESGE